ncbi:MAG: 2,3-bisphosphoglycerate-independent phosphoglycerate mutase, partial [Acetanaerobacterium sp.]
MKYLVLLCDGMSDYPADALLGKTPMEAAHKPAMDRLAASAEVGLLKTVAEGLKPGSDVANLSVMGYDPFVCYAGRSPLEAASIGIDLSEADVATRCNLVTLSDEDEFADKTMVDYCADDISTEEADVLIKFLQSRLGDDVFSFYTGISYRHCLVWRNGPAEMGTLTPPHDITLQKITNYLPQNERFLELTMKSYELLKKHPLNLERVKKGRRPANSIWLWGSGRKKPLADFGAKYGVKGSVISAVDLIKGIGRLANLEVLEVAGATG